MPASHRGSVTWLRHKEESLTGIKTGTAGTSAVICPPNQNWSGVLFQCCTTAEAAACVAVQGHQFIDLSGARRSCKGCGDASVVEGVSDNPCLHRQLSSLTGTGVEQYCSDEQEE